MFNNMRASGLRYSIIASVAGSGFFFAHGVSAQSTQSLPPQPRQATVQPAPEIPPDLNSRPPRAVQRIGTAIPPPRNTVSIKSTDAGAIPRQSPLSPCINCGVVDFVHPLAQGQGMNAIVSGVVAGTIARGVIGSMQPPHDGHHPPNHHGGGHTVPPQHPYQVGITLDDGRQAIIAIPEGANFQQGDRIRWVDGTLVLDRPAVP